MIVLKRHSSCTVYTAYRCARERERGRVCQDETLKVVEVATDRRAEIEILAKPLGVLFLPFQMHILRHKPGAWN